jgi:hypothetical protein
MDNPEKLATLAHKTHDEYKQKQNTTQKKDEHNGHH